MTRRRLPEPPRGVAITRYRCAPWYVRFTRRLLLAARDLVRLIFAPSPWN